MITRLQEPSEEFVKFFAARVYSGKVTTTVREKFALVTRRAFRGFITDQLNERLKTALGDSSPTVSDVPAPPAATPAAALEAVAPNEEQRPAIVTTEEEHEAFLTIRAILREVIDVRRVALRDQQSYCGVLLDDNNRRPICRLYFNGTKKSVGLFDNEERKEERLALSDLTDLFALAPRLQATVGIYESKVGAPA